MASLPDGCIFACWHPFPFQGRNGPSRCTQRIPICSLWQDSYLRFSGLHVVELPNRSKWYLAKSRKVDFKAFYSITLREMLRYESISVAKTRRCFFWNHIHCNSVPICVILISVSLSKPS